MWTPSMILGALVLVLVLACSPVARAQAPEGPLFQVTPYTTSAADSLPPGVRIFWPPFTPSVAGDATGSFVVVWDRPQAGSGSEVFGRRYDAGGVALGPEFQVTGYTTGDQFAPAVAADAVGSFVVVWMDYGRDGSGFGAFGQRYDSSGVRLGSEFRVSAYTAGHQVDPTVASDPGGNFVVAWNAFHNTTTGPTGIFGQRYDSTGSPVGSEFQVNAYTTGGPGQASVASDAAGNFVIVWATFGQDGSGYGVFGRRFAASGAPLGPEFQVNSYTTGSQWYPSVASDSTGKFVVAWHSDPFPGHWVAAQRYDSTGAPVGGEFQVGPPAALSVWPSVALDSNGYFTVAWPGYDLRRSVLARRYDPQGTPQGASFKVKPRSDRRAGQASVAATPGGSFVIAWSSSDGYTPANRVEGQRYVPVAGTKGDFSDDGKTDILFRHQASGKNVVWTMDGVTRTGGYFTLPATLPDTNWQIVGAADFNYDQRTDMLWRNLASGKTVVWYMDGITRTAGVYTIPDRFQETGWNIVATADFDRDLRTDILWHGPTPPQSFLGENAVWLMNGITQTYYASQIVPYAIQDTNWTVAGAADFNSDSETDILWRHQGSGKIAVWYMEGVSKTAGAYTSPSAIPDTRWQIAAVGDYDGDRKPDILWRNFSSGKIVAWLMDGVTRTAGVYTNPDSLPDTNWKIVGPK